MWQTHLHPPHLVSTPCLQTLSVLEVCGPLAYRPRLASTSKVCGFADGRSGQMPTPCLQAGLQTRRARRVCFARLVCSHTTICERRVRVRKLRVSISAFPPPSTHQFAHPALPGDAMRPTPGHPLARSPTHLLIHTQPYTHTHHPPTHLALPGDGMRPHGLGSRHVHLVEPAAAAAAAAAAAK
jgi:hypothetical protein